MFITTYSTIFILVWIFALSGHALYVKKNYIPISNTCVALGVLGTFIGILLGLWDFRTDDISGSIPILLDGLKTAFITSIAGMGIALFLRYWNTSHAEDQDLTEEEETIKTQREIVNLLTSINEKTPAEKDSLLLAQLQRIRVETGDSITELNATFREFVNEQANQNSAALMESLNQVLESFQITIQERLGESFDRLSDSCTQLNEWQKEYHNTIQLSTEILNHTASSVEGLSDGITSMMQNVSIFGKNSEALNKQITLFEEHARAIASLKEDWRTLLPQIEQNVVNLTSGVSKAVGRSAEGVSNTTRQMEAALTIMLNGTTERLRDELERINRDMAQRYDDLLKGLFTPLLAVQTRIVTDYERAIINNIHNVQGPDLFNNNGL